MSLRLRSVLAAGCLALAQFAIPMSSGLRAGDELEGPLYPAECKPRRWTDAWYEQEAQSPVGARQKKHKGKLWPPYPRPTGKEQQFSHKFHAAHYWPFPYNCDDRMYVKELSARQVDNGWTAATTLYDYHFDPDTNEINKSGRLHLRWILESTPVSRRMVFVQSTFVPETIEIRLNSARQELMQMVGTEPAPPVMVRIAAPYGRPASEIDLIRRAELGGLPVPHIPYSSDSGGGGGGGQNQGM